jgi:hypothetical protein
VLSPLGGQAEREGQMKELKQLSRRQTLLLFGFGMAGAVLLAVVDYRDDPILDIGLPAMVLVYVAVSTTAWALMMLIAHLVAKR